jgi:hypothetical protein
MFDKPGVDGRPGKNDRNRDADAEKKFVIHYCISHVVRVISSRSP